MQTRLTIGKTTYEVKRENEDPDSTKPQVSYVLTGPRGASYALMRNRVRPHLLFAFNNRNFTKSTPFRDKWFSDKDGALKYLG